MEEFAYGGKKHKLSEGFNDVAIYIGEHGAESGGRNYVLRRFSE